MYENFQFVKKIIIFIVLFLQNYKRYNTNLEITRNDFIAVI